MIPHTLINQPALPIFPFEHLKNTSAPYSLISHNTDEEVLTCPRDPQQTTITLHWPLLNQSQDFISSLSLEEI
jgi:hypothetical protein